MNSAGFTFVDISESYTTAPRSGATLGPTTSPILDLFAPELLEDPYPTYARLRANHTSRYVSPKGRELVVLSRYADVQLALRDPRLGRARDAERLRTNLGNGSLSRSFADWMLFKDPPDHTRLRSLVTHAFTPRTVERLQHCIRQIVDQLLFTLRDQREFDLITGFAAPLPVLVICELLGVPTEDRHLLGNWSASLAAAMDRPSSPTAEILDESNAAADGLTTYFRDLIKDRRTTPSDDLLSGLIAARYEGNRLSEDELLATCVMLFFAGHETTVNLIGNGVLALFRHPEQLDLLRHGSVHFPQAVDELLRFDSPVQRTSRDVLVDVELADGEVIPAGETVVLLIGAANRDTHQFTNAERLDLSRSNAARHLSFGAGVHYCIGAPLARMEAQIAITQLLRGLPQLQLIEPVVNWRWTFVLRGLRALRMAG